MYLAKKKTVARRCGTDSWEAAAAVIVVVVCVWLVYDDNSKVDEESLPVWFVHAMPYGSGALLLSGERRAGKMRDASSQVIARNGFCG